MRFYLSLSCQECDNEVRYGPTLTLDTHRGLPVVPVEVVEQTNFVCDRCDTQNWTGEVELISMPPDVDEDEEDVDVD